MHKDRSAQLSTAELHNGDCMTQLQFHRMYEQMPDGFKAELVGGVVFVCEPLGVPHGTSHLRLGSLFDAYQASTPGVEASDNVTVILSKKDEVQPDLCLRVLPACKGQSRNTKHGFYVQGAPELIAEVAHTSKSIDLHMKKQRYARAGVLEYIVLCLKPAELRWFDLQKDVQLDPDAEGVFRSLVFPGLWIGLLGNKYHQVMNVLNRGLASADHADFVARLDANQQSNLF